MPLAHGVQLGLSDERIAETRQRGDQRLDLVRRVVAQLGRLDRELEVIWFTQSPIRSSSRGDGARRRDRFAEVSSTNTRTSAPPSKSGRLRRRRSSTRALCARRRVRVGRRVYCSR
jgi:hypothetical protein